MAGSPSLSKTSRESFRTCTSKLACYRPSFPRGGTRKRLLISCCGFRLLEARLPADGGGSRWLNRRNRLHRRRRGRRRLQQLPRRERANRNKGGLPNCRLAGLRSRAVRGQDRRPISTSKRACESQRGRRKKMNKVIWRWKPLGPNWQS